MTAPGRVTPPAGQDWRNSPPDFLGNAWEDMQADCSWRHAKSVSSLQTCRHLQSTRSGFFYKHRPQPKSDVAFIYLSQQSNNPVSIQVSPSSDCSAEWLE